MTMASRILRIYCRRCEAHMVSYRKEGSGALLRLYLDRIEPVGGAVKIKNLHSDPSQHLACPQCNERIGSPFQHRSRSAWRLIPGSFRKKEI